MKTALIVLFLLTAMVVGGAFLAGPGIGTGLPSFKSEPPRTEVRMQVVSRKPLVQTVKAPGQIDPRTKVEISSEVSARIEQLPFREGETVKKGDLIVKLDDRDLKAALASAKARRDGEQFRLRSEEARLAGLISNLDFAQRESERRKALLATGDIAARDAEEAEDTVRNLESSVAAAKHTMSVIESSLASANADIERAEDGLNKTTIRAPMDGVITLLNAEVGEVVLVGTMNNPGTVILTIADLSRMILTAEVAESDIALVEEGQPAKVAINAYRNETFSGVVTHIALQRTANLDGTGHFEVEVEIDTQGRLIRSGGLANVDVEVATHEGLVVESQAVVDLPMDRLPDGLRSHPLVQLLKKTTPVVFRVVDGKAVCTPVTVGPSDLTSTILADGVSQDDVVVIGPYKVLETLKDGDLVKPLGDNTPAPEAVAQPTPQEATASTSTS